MLRIATFPPGTGDLHTPSRDCACCGARYPVRRRGMRLLSGDSLEGDICPECVLQGPAGAAARIRGRLLTLDDPGGDTVGGEDRTPWVQRMMRRARLLEETPSFSLVARQAAARETRERR